MIVIGFYKSWLIALMQGNHQCFSKGSLKCMYVNYNHRYHNYPVNSKALEVDVDTTANSTFELVCSTIINHQIS